MANRLMNWWRSNVANLDPIETVGYELVTVRAKTQQEIAQDILVKYDFCPIHLKKKGFFDDDDQRFRYGCKNCVEEKKLRAKLEREIRAAAFKATKDLEIAFALSVLKKESGASSS